LIPIPIQTVLSSMRKNGVQTLLMGGQACVLYGAAEFSRDTDFAILCSPQNLRALQNALDELEARVIAVPPFEIDYLQRGHAVHFRCSRPDTENQRIDVMSVMRGVAPFGELWERRTTVFLSDDLPVELMALPDLVKAKKTQRAKDWPMIEQLVSVHYFENRDEPTPERIGFWLCESRTPELLKEAYYRFPHEAGQLSKGREVLRFVAQGEASLRAALIDEQEYERQRDRAYWQPLKAELEQLRRAHRNR
jgi:PHD/YefM family antitoxin component YafN of YafNO toxin-antitoxin module